MSKITHRDLSASSAGGQKVASTSTTGKQAADAFRSRGNCR